MKVSVITPVFALSGVPLAQFRLARSIASRGHNVDFVVGRILPGYVLIPPPNVNCIIFHKENVRSLLLPLIRYLSSEKPEIVFSAEDHLNIVTLTAVLFTGCDAKICCSSRVTPFDTYSQHFFTKRWFLKICMHAIMWRADLLTCVSKDMVKQYQTLFRKSPHVCVYNIVLDSFSESRIQEPVNHPWTSDNNIPLLVAAGTLASWKGFQDLIDAISLVNEVRPVRLLILGDGPLRHELQDRILHHKLDDSIQLLGFVDNPLKYFSCASIFVLSSYVEGLPNVLVEAMMCGCTPVATDCPTGPREVLNDGLYGYLVEPHNPSSIADGILKALKYPIKPSMLAEAISPFSEHRVIGQYTDLLNLSSFDL